MNLWDFLRNYTDNYDNSDERGIIDGFAELSRDSLGDECVDEFLTTLSDTFEKALRKYTGDKDGVRPSNSADLM